MGYETALNLMKVSTLSNLEVGLAVQKINKSNVDMVYIVDSFLGFIPLPNDIELSLHLMLGTPSLNSLPPIPAAQEEDDESDRIMEAMGGMARCVLAIPSNFESNFVCEQSRPTCDQDHDFVRELQNIFLHTKG